VILEEKPVAAVLVSQKTVHPIYIYTRLPVHEQQTCKPVN